MTPRDIALARKRSYELFGRLFLEGIREEDRPVLAELPELAPHLPKPFDADDVAAIHQSLFGFNLLPFQSVFLTPERVLGGETTDMLQRQASGLGYASAASGNIDHIGQQLLLLAYLCGGEAVWLAKGELREAALLAADQSDWLDGQLLRWLFPFVTCLRRQGDAFYGAMGEMALALLADHRQATASEPGKWRLPEPPAVLEDDKSGLKEIATYLMTPVYGGLFLTKDDLSALGRQFRLPRGFGSRDQMMTNLLRSAAQYDGVASLMEAFRELLDSEIAAYEQWQREWPSLESFLSPWSSRLQATIGLTETILEQSQRLMQESD